MIKLGQKVHLARISLSRILPQCSSCHCHVISHDFDKSSYLQLSKGYSHHIWAADTKPKEVFIWNSPTEHQQHLVTWFWQLLLSPFREESHLKQPHVLKWNQSSTPALVFAILSSCGHVILANLFITFNNEGKTTKIKQHVSLLKKRPPGNLSQVLVTTSLWGHGSFENSLYLTL